MNRLFEALSDIEKDQLATKAASQAVAPRDEIHLVASSNIVAAPNSVPQAGTEQFLRWTILPEIYSSDRASSTPVRQSETDPSASSALPKDVFPTDMASLILVLQTEMDQMAKDGVAPAKSLSPAGSTNPARQAETERTSTVAIAPEVPALGVGSLNPVQQVEAKEVSTAALPQDVFPSDVTSLVLVLEAETDASSSDLPLLILEPETVTEQLSLDFTTCEASSSSKASPDGRDLTSAPSRPTQSVVEVKESQSKPPKSGLFRRVSTRVTPESRLVALTEPDSLGAEKFRALVARLEHWHRQSELKSFQVTSSVISEGKTLVSGNVAVTLAKHLGSKTLLIEGDLHRPTLAKMFGLDKMRGVNHWWSGRDQDLAQFVHQVDDLPLWFLPAGKPNDRPSDILRSARFVNALAELTSRFEWIVVDSTPMVPIVDVNLWSRLVDGTLLVVREGVTPVKALQQGLKALDHPNIIGMVMNEATAADDAKYGQYYGSPKLGFGG